MSEPNVHNTAMRIAERFDTEMVEPRDSRSGRAIVDMSDVELDDFELMYWLEEQGFEVTIRENLYYDDGTVEGTPIDFEIPHSE
jgi:hypothetical protein